MKTIIYDETTHKLVPIEPDAKMLVAARTAAQAEAVRLLEHPELDTEVRECLVLANIHKAMLASAPEAAGVEGGWQPIETAPLRDAVIVHHDAHWTRLACRHEDRTFWPWPSRGGDECLAYAPTHWMPLPSAPQPVAKGGE